MQNFPAPDLSLQLGMLHEMAREKEKAAQFYNHTLSGGYYPEALMALARLAAQARNNPLARQHLESALNIDRPLGDKAVGPLPLFNQILGQLLELEEPVPNCRAWRAHLLGLRAPHAFAAKSALVYAPTSQAAEAMLQMLFAKMQPGVPPIVGQATVWREAEKEYQPDGPVRAGVQAILN